jgi:glycosyltransferase involved in cell wall biosynthesis
MPDGVLFVHNNFPGQFQDLAEALVAAGVRCAAIGQQHATGLPGVRMAQYGLAKGTTEGIWPLAVRAEADLIRAHGALRAARALKAEGFDPAVIVGHPGWGETLLLSEVFPQARQVAFAEFYYHARGFDVGFDEEFNPQNPDTLLRIKPKNLAMSVAYAEADAIVAPTRFQASALPFAFRDRTRIIHEGVDVEAIRPGPPEPFEIGEGDAIAPGTPVITHVNNNLEPLRGLHIFLRALPRLLAEVPDAQVLVVGAATKSSYGGTAPDGKTWLEVCAEGLPLPPERVRFLGRIDHARMLAALRLSTAHVYYTYPFVLSWSLVEAMAAGCYVIGSDTAPLHDAIDDGINGRLLPFFDVDALSQAMIDACRDPGASAPMRAAARETAVAQFSRDKGRAAWLDLLGELGLSVPAASRSGSL